MSFSFISSCLLGCVLLSDRPHATPFDDDHPQCTIIITQKFQFTVMLQNISRYRINNLLYGVFLKYTHSENSCTSQPCTADGCDDLQGVECG